jgi:hypothetical protein
MKRLTLELLAIAALTAIPIAAKADCSSDLAVCQINLFSCNSDNRLISSFLDACNTTQSNLIKGINKCAADVITAQYETKKCNDDITSYTEAVAEYSSLLNQGIEGLKTANKINQSLRVKIKKLQKACGSRCQNIR